MSTYTVTTNFANKDTLPSGSADKIIRGAEFTTEFNNIATAVNSKADSSALTSGLSGKVDTSDLDFVKLTQVTATAAELNHVAGVTSSIQDQLDVLAGGSGGSYVSTTDADYVKLTQVNATSTELNYVDGVTANIQTQINVLQGLLNQLEGRVILLEEGGM